MNRQQNSYWEQQKNGQWKTLTNPLKSDQEIKSHLDNFVTTFYWKFREKQGVKKGTYKPEINFQGFSGFEDYSEKEDRDWY